MGAVAVILLLGSIGLRVFLYHDDEAVSFTPGDNTTQMDSTSSIY